MLTSGSKRPPPAGECLSIIPSLINQPLKKRYELRDVQNVKAPLPRCVFALRCGSSRTNAPLTRMRSDTTKLSVSSSQLRWLSACQFQLCHRHWLNGSDCDTCHKLLNVCSFQQDGWARTAARGRMTFVACVYVCVRVCCCVALFFLPPRAVNPSFL